MSGMKVKEGIRPTPLVLGVALLAMAMVGGCSDSLRELIYNDSLLCGSALQACAPDGGRFDLHIVDRTTYLVANPSIPSFDMAAKPGTSIVGFAFVMVSPRQDSGVIQVFPDAGVVDYDIMYTEFDTDAGTVPITPQRVQTVQRFFGISLAYQPNGNPAVAYLGGPLQIGGASFLEGAVFQNQLAAGFPRRPTASAPAAAHG